jgi:hypothetical protein
VSSSARARLLAGVAVVATCLGALLATLPDIGLTDDADSYLGAAISYASWGERLLSGDLSALRREAVDRHWRANPEHPPLAKEAMGATWWLLHRTLGWMGQVDAARVATVLVTTVLAAVLFWTCWTRFGRVAGVAAPLLLLTMPRFFFHAHAETLDATVAATCFFAVVAYAGGPLGPGRALACGVLFGLALASKLNAPFLLLALAAFALARPRAPTAGPRLGGARRVPGEALAWASLLVVGPLLALALWPWLWFDTGSRVAAYLAFHLRHYPILFLYLGRVYDATFAPWHAPFVMTALTTPPVTLALGAAGLVRAFVAPFTERGWWPRRAARAGAGGPGGGHEAEGAAAPGRELALLLAMWALVAIGTVAFSGGPKYGGVKLFLPFFPPFAALAGWALQGVVDALRRRGAPRWTAPAVAAGLLLPGAVSLARIHPYHLSYYNALAGGLPGAERLGLETQYYDLFHVELAEWMNRSLPPGSRVTFLPNNKEYLRSAPWWVTDGRLRRDLRLTGPEEADVLVLTHERRWPSYPALREAYRDRPVLWVLRVEGVPLLDVIRLR